MPVSIDIHENEFLEEIYQEGQQKGVEKGIEKGREQERAAARDSARALLMDMLHEKFGALPPAIENRLSAADLPQLQRWTRRVLTATGLDETLD